MLEQKLLVNRFIDLTLATSPVKGYADGDFVLAPVQNCYLQESTGVFTKTSAVQPGPGPKAHRNFKWLPWVPGAISEVALVDTDVLTGPMSGCWLVTYKKPSGVVHVGHIGTDTGSPVRTNAVNTAWNGWAIANSRDVVGGFNPLRHWNGPIPARLENEPARSPKILGLLTPKSKYYAIVAYQQASPATMLRIAGIQQIPSAMLGRLQQVDLPGP